MTDIKEPINTTSDGTFLSVVCENPEKSVVGQKLGGHNPPRNYPPDILRFVLTLPRNAWHVNWFIYCSDVCGFPPRARESGAGVTNLMHNNESQNVTAVDNTPRISWQA